MFAQTREEVRSHFLAVWRKMSARVPLEPLEALIAGVIERHPEYHELLDRPAHAMNAEGSDESGVNPFLHMSLHIAVLEQLQTDRPPGVVDAYRRIVNKRRNDTHAVEHAMMDCLTASLWEAQQNSAPPDESAYLDCLRRAG